MYRLLLKVIWNALSVVALVLFILWVLGLFPPAPPKKEVTTSPPVLEAIKHVNKQIFGMVLNLGKLD